MMYIEVIIIYLFFIQKYFEYAVGNINRRIHIIQYYYIGELVVLN